MRITRESQNDIFKERMLFILAIALLVIMFSAVCGKLDNMRVENQELQDEIYELQTN